MGYCSCHAHSAAAKAHALAEWRQRLESRANGADAAAGALAPPRAARAVAGASNASKGVGATGIGVDVLCQRPGPTAASFTAAVLVVVEAVARPDRPFLAVLAASKIAVGPIASTRPAADARQRLGDAARRRRGADRGGGDSRAAPEASSIGYNAQGDYYNRRNSISSMPPDADISTTTTTSGRGRRRRGHRRLARLPWPPPPARNLPRSRRAR